MHDLRRRFATLDDVPVPELWPEIERRADEMRQVREPLVSVEPSRPRPTARESTPRTRGLDRRALWYLVAAAALVVALLAGLVSVGSTLFPRPTTLPSTEPSVDVVRPSGLSTLLPSEAGPSPTSGPTNVAIETGGLLVPRGEGRAAVRLQDGKVLLVGGKGGATDAELYDPALKTWSETGATSKPRLEQHSLTLLDDGRVLVAGGIGSQSVYTGGVAQLDAEVYDPTSGTWSSAGSMVHPRSNGVAVRLRDGRVLMVGGYDIRRATYISEIYTPATSAWKRTASTMAVRWPVDAVLLDDGTVLVVGTTDVGSSSHGTPFQAVRYDPATDRWTGVANPLPTGCRSPRLIALDDGRVLALCGTVYDEDPPSAQVYDPVADTWTAVAEPPRSLTGPVVRLLDGRVLVSDDKAGALFSADRGTWTDAALPDWHTVAGQFTPDTMTVLADGHVLLTMGWTIFLYTPPAP